MRLSNHKVRLRALEPEDLDLLYDWENREEIAKVSNLLSPFSRMSLSNFLSGQTTDLYRDQQMRLMVVEQETGREVGTVELFDFDPRNLRAGIGILVAEPRDRRKGLAQASVELVAEYSRSTLLLKQLYCDIAASNQASLRLFEAAGFVRTGIRRAWLQGETGWEDVHFLQRLLR